MKQRENSKYGCIYQDLRIQEFMIKHYTLADAIPNQTLRCCANECRTQTFSEKYMKQFVCVCQQIR